MSLSAQPEGTASAPEPSRMESSGDGRIQQPRRGGLATRFHASMAEPREETAGPQRPEERPESAPSKSDTASILFPNSAIPSTDDEPTVISRPNSAPAEDALAGVLRGRKLAHFELEETIGVGGMAAVILARDTQLDRKVALKILPPEMARDPENVRRFHQEARAAAKLDHENIARVFYCGEDEGLHFIAFEFVEGENLRVLLERRGRVPVPEAIRTMLQVTTGLGHAAERGVVHRDIKPSNIIIGPNGRAKLVDMGLARSLEPHSDGDLTQSGVTLGTFDYISPEQALEPREADVRSDIYSLGCTFYHMLTGEPPVPDGTAAKKLHHHQHIDPTDPRQLNPEIPDELAALLGRMMAKDPKARYQRPEELAQHLVILAHKSGAITEIPDNIVFTNPPLPAPSRTRPLVLAVAAMLGVVTLVAILPPGTGTPPPPPSPAALQRGAAPAADTRDDQKELPDAPPERPERENSGAVATEASIPTWRTGDVKSLAEFLEKNPVANVYLTKDLDLTREDQLVFRGSKLTIEADPTDSPEQPTIRLSYDSTPAYGSPWAALTVKSGTVTIKGVRFEVDAREADIYMSAVALEGGQLNLERCEFVGKFPPSTNQGHLSSISVKCASGDPDKKPWLSVAQCYFAPGQHAISLTGAVTAVVKHCAFAPHTGCLFDLYRPGQAPGSETSLTLTNCSAFITAGSVFRLENGVSCRLDAVNSIVSCPADELQDRAGPSLIEEAGSVASKFHYRGSGNRYHNLKYFLVKSRGEEQVASLSGFRHRFGVDDATSQEVTSSPWEQRDPLQALLNGEPRLAFRVDSKQPQLRPRENVLGVDSCVWGKTYDKLPPMTDKKVSEAPSARPERIVDPTLSQAEDNRFKTLRQALEDVAPGTVISIKYDGLLRVEPVRLEKAGVDVTIRPYHNSHPVLTMGQTTESDAALFRVYDSQLRLEQLEFHLLPGRSEFKAQTIVAVMGDGRCTFKDCVVTLEENREVPLSVVTLADTTGVMKMGPQSSQQLPEVKMEGCFARGTGSLVKVSASRPFNLSVEDSLVALEGSFLVVEGNPREQGARSMHAEVALKQVTAYLTEHLIWLRALKEEGRIAKGLVPMQMRPVTNCLFVSANGKSLVHCDGLDSDEQMKRCLSWAESGHNAYSNFSLFLDQQPTMESSAMAPAPYGRSQWEDFTQEPNARFERIRFYAPPAADMQLARSAPMDFKTRPDINLQNYGADVERLPKAMDDPASSAVTP
jgi:serine/threonine protein kinase